jgi:CheY-like chemotaxis protein
MESADLEDVRILLVEDNSEHRETMALVLQGFGARVYLASTVEEALGRWRLVLPHVIVSDIFLETSTGMGLLRSLRGQGCTVPAVAVTGWGDDDTRAMSANAGFAAHLAKPVAPSVLLTTLTSVLPRRGPMGR